MYITYEKKKYSCNCTPSSSMIYRGLPDDFPDSVSGEIVLYADDGFVLRTDRVEDYLRQTFVNGVLTLTNVPEKVRDSEYEVFIQISDLKSQLESTDYKIIKCSEAQLVGEELPYDIVSLHTERQAIRDKINELEGVSN